MTQMAPLAWWGIPVLAEDDAQRDAGTLSMFFTADEYGDVARCRAARTGRCPAVPVLPAVPPVSRGLAALGHFRLVQQPAQPVHVVFGELRSCPASRSSDRMLSSTGVNLPPGPSPAIPSMSARVCPLQRSIQEIGPPGFSESWSAGSSSVSRRRNSRESLQHQYQQSREFIQVKPTGCALTRGERALGHGDDGHVCWQCATTSGRSGRLSSARSGVGRGRSAG